MNIQIFGFSKSFDTKKTQRYFSERNIKVQYINLKEKTISPGEWDSIKRAVGGFQNMLDDNCKDKKLLTLYKYLTDEDKEAKMFENQILVKAPIVRNGSKATVGYCPEVWKNWD